MGQGLNFCGGGMAGAEVPPGIPLVSLLALLTAQYDAEGGAAPNVIVRLFANDIEVEPTVELADFVEATFDGYAEVTVEANAPDYDTDGNPFMAVPTALFDMTGATTPETVFGYYLVGAVSGNLLMAERFPVPKPMQETGDTINITTQIKLINIPPPEEEE